MGAHKTSEFVVERILPDVRRGRMVILVDSEERENEGDLFIAAEKATPEAINFMAQQGRGLISLALTEGRMRELGLSLIADDQINTTKFHTAFATPIDAREGVGSGMSAHDRARTIQVAIADSTRPDDLIRPGRLQTLRAIDGGVLARRGHTEAAQDRIHDDELHRCRDPSRMQGGGRGDGEALRLARPRADSDPMVRGPALGTGHS